MAINMTQVREMIVEVLQWMHPVIPYSDTAVELLMLTAATESHLGTYTKQVNGPALGIFQMEPATEKDIGENYLSYKQDLRVLVSLLYHSSSLKPLRYNLAYQIAMARIHYYRVKASLPVVQRDFEGRITYGSIKGLAEYWKKHYNTELGKGTAVKAIRDYINLVGGDYV